MMRYILRLVGVMLLGWLTVTAGAMLLGHILPPEDEILLTAVSSRADLEIYRMALYRHMMVLLTPSTSDEIQAAWSPDGQANCIRQQPQRGE